jgi:signal transduction histidine kinase
MVKNITVTLGAIPERPPEVWNGIKLAPSINKLGRDIRDEPDWGDGRKAYLWVTVEDTGLGLTPEEDSHLFTRFSQATPRTHVRSSFISHSAGFGL